MSGYLGWVRPYFPARGEPGSGVPESLPAPDRHREIPDDVLVVAEQVALNLLLSGWAPSGEDAYLTRAEWAREAGRINREYDRWARLHARPRRARRRTFGDVWDGLMRSLGG